MDAKNLGSQPVGAVTSDGVWTGGLTKRELFAALALQGFIARAAETHAKDASEAVRAADDLLDALAK